MLRHSKGGRLEAGNSVAEIAVVARGRRGELSAMRIGFMAIGAFRKVYWLVEASAVVTLLAGDSGMQPQKRIPCSRMIEFSSNIQRRPARLLSDMANPARIPEFSGVRIPMTGRAILKGQVFIFWSFFRGVQWRVAFVARDLLVHSFNAVSGLSVIEMRRPFPIQFVMTLFARDR